MTNHDPRPLCTEADCDSKSDWAYELSPLDKRSCCNTHKMQVEQRLLALGLIGPLHSNPIVLERLWPPAERGPDYKALHHESSELVARQRREIEGLITDLASAKARIPPHGQLERLERQAKDNALAAENSRTQAIRLGKQLSNVHNGLRDLQDLLSKGQDPTKFVQTLLEHSAPVHRAPPAPAETTKADDQPPTQP